MSRVLSTHLPCHLVSSEEIQEAVVGVVEVIMSIIEETKEWIKAPVCWCADWCVVSQVPLSNDVGTVT